MTTLLNTTIETINNQQATPEGRFFNAAEAPRSEGAHRLIGQLAVLKSRAEAARPQLAEIGEEDWTRYRKAMSRYVHGERDQTEIEPFTSVRQLLEDSEGYTDATSAIIKEGSGLVAFICKLPKPQMLIFGEDTYWTKHDARNQGRMEGWNTSTEELVLFNHWTNIGEATARSAGLEDYVRLLQNVEQARVGTLNTEALPRSA
jgi:hypothetical protein